MKFVFSPLLRCPLDDSPLQLEGTCLQCENQHSFDIARQGYVNLLAASDKRSRDPGDDKDMVAARRAFLTGGHYAPLALRLAALITPLAGNSATIVDAGCGEGYYLHQLQQHLEKNEEQMPALIGFDISKWAVQAACKRFPATWLVASNRQIPLEHGSVDCLLSVFGFPVYESFRRLLKADGMFLSVTAGPRHLIELREVIYPDVRQTPSTVVQQASAAGFRAGETVTLEFQTEPLTQSEINQLLAMTPHLHRASREGLARAQSLNGFSVTVDVLIHALHP